MNTKYRSKAGLTLIEIMIALAIIAIFAAVAIPVFSYVRKRAAVSAIHEYVTNCASVLTAYKEQYGAIPVTANLTTADITALQGTDVTLAANGDNVRLEMVLAASEPGWKWFDTGLTEQVTPVPNQSVSFNLQTKKFNGTASVTAGSYATYPRLECTRVAAADQFNLAGNGAIPLGTKIVQLVIPSVDAEVAENVINKFNPQFYTPNATHTQAQKETALAAVNGVVKVGTFDATTHLTDLRIYVGQF